MSLSHRAGVGEWENRGLHTQKKFPPLMWGECLCGELCSTNIAGSDKIIVVVVVVDVVVVVVVSP